MPWSNRRIGRSSPPGGAVWAQTTFKERADCLGRLRNLIIEEMDAIAGGLTSVTGKTPVEAVMTEIIPTVENLRYLEKNAAKFLSPEKRPTPFSYRHSSSHVERHPWGWVLILSPWNFPFQLSLVPMATALAAGNAVVLKPSELSTEVGKMIVSLFYRAGFPKEVVALAPGDGLVGQRLIDAKPDLIFLTGGTETGKKVMAAAAAHLIPVILELGGKDPMIVFDDAPFDRAVEAAVYGAFANAGQVCVSVERLYVQEGLRRLRGRAGGADQRLRVGQSMDDDMGPLTNPRQADIVNRHIDDALSKGARLATARWSKGPLLSPVVMTQTNHAMAVMTEETFGPVLPVMSFRTEEEAVALANDSRFGLNASVWTRDLDRGRRVAARLAVGNCAVNDVLKNIGNPHLPFGGIKHSGFGRSHGPEGLRAFTYEKSVMVNQGTARRELNWFPYSRAVYENLRVYLHMSFLKKPLLAKLKGLWGFMRAFRQSQKKEGPHGH
ncbi:MAG: aldehyde dehydrogenase family protein [Elusimicrobia bacterium]|nr:aldehyde dehydrogenase family protein [Elusimicrobiota bacterium]